MLIFIVRRLGFMVITLILASLLIFAATQILPGDVATMVLGRFATEQALDNFREEMGLNRSLIVQYGDWLLNFVQGDWGESLSTRADVRDLVMERLRNSAMLASVAFVMYVPLGIVLGVVAAIRRNSWVDHVISVGSLAFIGLPEFVTGLLLIAVFALRLDWFPSSSAIAPDAAFFERDTLERLVLPALTISLVSLAYIARMTRSSTAEVLSMDYVRTAYLKGLSRSRVIGRHVLRNALLPTVTVVAIGIGWLIGGLIVTESLFSFPGIGRLLLFGIQRRDLPLIQATTMVIVVIFTMANLLADILYGYLNPRIRFR